MMPIKKYYRSLMKMVIGTMINYRILHITKKFIFLYMIMFLYSCSVYDGRDAAECRTSKGCLNDVLIEQHKEICANKSCDTTLETLTNKDFNQVIFLRKYQFDLSKSCGELSISWKQRALFSEDCDYLVFSEGSNMTNYIRGACFSANSKLSQLSNNINFLNKDNISPVNQVLDENQKIHMEQKGIYLQISPQEERMTELDCFKEFNRQAP